MHHTNRPLAQSFMCTVCLSGNHILQAVAGWRNIDLQCIVSCCGEVDKGLLVEGPADLWVALHEAVDDVLQGACSYPHRQLILCACLSTLSRPSGLSLLV